MQKSIKKIFLIIVVSIYLVGIGYFTNLVREACHHHNCKHGWYSKYNQKEKNIATLWYVFYPLGAMFLYFKIFKSAYNKDEDSLLIKKEETPYGSLKDYVKHLKKIGVSQDQVDKEILKYNKINDEKMTKKEKTISEKIKNYESLSSILLSDEALQNEKIYIHALASLYSGFTTEETIMHSYLFDITSQIDKAKNDVLKMMNIFKSTTSTLTIFKQWKDGGKIDIKLWENDVIAINVVTTPSANQLVILKTILDELNDFKQNH